MSKSSTFCPALANCLLFFVFDQCKNSGSPRGDVRVERKRYLLAHRFPSRVLSCLMLLTISTHNAILSSSMNHYNMKHLISILLRLSIATSAISFLVFAPPLFASSSRRKLFRWVAHTHSRQHLWFSYLDEMCRPEKDRESETEAKSERKENR